MTEPKFKTGDQVKTRRGKTGEVIEVDSAHGTLGDLADDDEPNYKVRLSSGSAWWFDESELSLAPVKDAKR